ncbi:MAG: iron ABC transporter permease [Pseudomonadota bacterium]|nr:iron ABC transporter permease [Pseudomonadota bacterium]
MNEYKEGARVLRAAPFLIALLVLVPIGIILSSFLTPADDIWRHLVETTLAELIFNTLLLAAGVAVGTTMLGVGLAWLTAVCDFPARKFFSWALLLPLALPSYVTAFVALGILDYTGPLQTALRGWSGSGLAWFPQVRGAGGIIVVMNLALYPYVYLLARSAFLTHGRRVLESAQALGLTQAEGFFRVALPMARPWIAAGVMLALMETLADFGTVSVFNYDTFTTAIYKAWFGLFSLPAASQLASLLIVVAFALLIVESRSRRRMRFAENRPGARAERIALRGWRKWSAFAFAATVFVSGFALPLAQLTIWASETALADIDSRYFGFLWHSLLLGAMAALLTCVIALLLAYAKRVTHDRWTLAAVRIATIGYALPGAVLAVGVFIAFAALDNALIAFSMHFFDANPGLILQGSLFVMLIAYVTRFLAVGYSPIDSALHRVTRNVDEAAISLGVARGSMLARVHLPMLRGGLFTAAALVFVDVMKEMPITLMTRPFGWDTLAVRIFEMTSEGDWQRAALPAIALVLAGLLPLIWLMRQTENAEPTRRLVAQRNAPAGLIVYAKP